MWLQRAGAYLVRTVDIDLGLEHPGHPARGFHATSSYKFFSTHRCCDGCQLALRGGTPERRLGTRSRHGKRSFSDPGMERTISARTHGERRRRGALLVLKEL